jgi:biotin carboxyl carrier protein
MAPVSTRTFPELGAPVGGDDRSPDPRGIRITLAPSTAGADLAPVVVEPLPTPALPADPMSATGTGLLAGTVAIRPVPSPDADGHGHVLVNGLPAEVELIPLDGERAILALGGAGGSRDRVLLLPPAPAPGVGRGVVRREVVVGGWRVEVEVEPAGRAALRERARRDRHEVGHSGPTEVRAIIPGVVVSVSVIPGDVVTAGRQLLVIEAMKMQNELRAPRDGTIERVAVGTGETIEVGDLLLVIT